jgi:hypothetical protein
LVSPQRAQLEWRQVDLESLMRIPPIVIAKIGAS